MEIKCEFDDLPWNYISPEKAYTCAVYTSCDITSRGALIAAFNGEHKESKNNESVQGLGFYGPKVHYIPKNLFEIFPNLVFLEFNECELKEVTVDDLVGLRKLKVFWAPDNKIESLPVNLFKNMPELKEVCFSRNLIQKFEIKTLEPIKDTIDIFEILDNPGISEKFERKEGEIENLIERLALETNESYGKKFTDLLKRFENLYTTGKHSDFTITVRDKEYRVHKCILASQSSVFDKMFTDDAEDSTKTFNKIKNFSQETFEEFLRYFYNKTIPSEESATDLLELAVEFDVPDLKLECEATISQTISQENARQIYNLAEQHSLSELKRTAFEVIKKCYPEVGEFIYEKPNLVNEIIIAKEEFQAKQEAAAGAKRKIYLAKRKAVPQSAVTPGLSSQNTVPEMVREQKERIAPFGFGFSMKN